MLVILEAPTLHPWRPKFMQISKLSWERGERVLAS